MLPNIVIHEDNEEIGAEEIEKPALSIE